MRPGAGQVEATDGHAIARVAEQRTPGEPLVEAGLEMERMPAGQPVLALQVSVGFSACPVDPFAGLLRPKATGKATVVKLQKLLAPPAA